jgi:hypothetical protein
LDLGESGGKACIHSQTQGQERWGAMQSLEQGPPQGQNETQRSERVPANAQGTCSGSVKSAQELGQFLFKTLRELYRRETNVFTPPLHRNWTGIAV